MGPSVLCLFIVHFEKLFLAQCEHYTPILCQRYIDDIVGAASCSTK